MKFNIIILLILSFSISMTFSQFKSASKSIVNNSDSSDFYLHYGFSGLGSNMGKFEPTINIRGSAFLYTYEQNSYYGKKNTRVDTVCIKKFRQSSIDSILEILKDLRDTSIIEYNFCVMSGGIHLLTVANGTDTTKFQLSNTFHYTALKIADILNEYAPEGKKLWANEQMIKDAEDCLIYLLKSADESKKKKSKSGRKKNGT